MGKVSNYLSGMSKSTKLGLVGALAFLGIAGAAAVATPCQEATCTSKTTTSTQTEVIPYTNSNVDDPTITKGQTKVTTQGVNGEKSIEHTVTTYTPDDCKPNTDMVSKETVTLQPVNQVTAVGTYVAPPPPPKPAPNCNPNYSPCVPNSSYDLDCPDIGMRVSVTGTDVYRLDADNDGVGCESY